MRAPRERPRRSSPPPLPSERTIVSPEAVRNRAAPVIARHIARHEDASVRVVRAEVPAADVVGPGAVPDEAVAVNEPRFRPRPCGGEGTGVRGTANPREYPASRGILSPSPGPLPRKAGGRGSGNTPHFELLDQRLEPEPLRLLAARIPARQPDVAPGEARSSASSTVTRWNDRHPANGIVGPGKTTSVAPASTEISHCCVLNDRSDGWIRVADWPTIMVRVPFFAVRAHQDGRRRRAAPPLD